MGEEADGKAGDGKVPDDVNYAVQIKRFSDFRRVVMAELFPQQSKRDNRSSRIAKCLDLGDLVRNLLAVWDDHSLVDDKYHGATKRLFHLDYAMATVLRWAEEEQQKQVRPECKRELAKVSVPPQDVTAYNALTSGQRTNAQFRSIRQNNFGQKPGSNTHANMVHSTRHTATDNDNMAMRLNIINAEDARSSERLLRPSHIGSDDPLHTPHGKSEGVRMHRCMISRVRWGVSVSELEMGLRTAGVVWEPLVDADTRVADTLAREAYHQRNKDKAAAADAAAMRAARVGLGLTDEDDEEGQDNEEVLEEEVVPEVAAASTYTRAQWMYNGAAIKSARDNGVLNSDNVLLYVNYRLVGMIRDTTPEAMYWRLMELRLRGALVPRELSVELGPRRVCVVCDDACMIRPVLVLSRLGEYLEFAREAGPCMDPAVFVREAFRRGMYVYISKAEECSAPIRVAMELSHLREFAPAGAPPFTHLELHTSLLLQGEALLNVPNATANQLPRNLFNTAMQQAAAFTPVTEREYGGTSLVTTQRQLVYTVSEEGRRIPVLGNNLRMGVVLRDDLKDDAMVLSQRLVDNGGLRTCVVYTVNVNTYKNRPLQVAHPSKFSNIARQSAVNNLEFLDESGVVRQGSVVQEKDVLVYRVERTEVHYQDVSIQLTERPEVMSLPGRWLVHKVVNHSTDTRRVISITLVRFRSPSVGDKICTMHGQKATISAILPTEDMPYDRATGVPLDILMNTTSLTSRMTNGQVMEMAMGVAAAREGRRMDGTSFKHPADTLPSQAAAAGASWFDAYKHMDKAELVDGATGEALRHTIAVPGKPGVYRDLVGRVSVGYVYCMLLFRHAAENKFYALGIKGPVNSMTGQPTEGRAQDGGMRIGNQERRAMIGHGVAATLDDTQTHSGRRATPVCADCGAFGNHPPAKLLENLPPDLTQEQVDVLCNMADAVMACPSCGGDNVVYVPLPPVLAYIDACMAPINSTFQFDVERV